MTTVSSVMRRSYTEGMFDDLTGGVPCAFGRDRVTGIVTLTFDGVLGEETTAAVWARMESSDDVDQEKRANLRDLRQQVVDAGVPTTLEEALVLIALMRQVEIDALGYWLGE